MKRKMKGQANVQVQSWFTSLVSVSEQPSEKGDPQPRVYLVPSSLRAQTPCVVVFVDVFKKRDSADSLAVSFFPQASVVTRS